MKDYWYWPGGVLAPRTCTIPPCICEPWEGAGPREPHHHDAECRDHATFSALDHVDRADCWCRPFMDYEDPVTKAQVWVHRDVSA